MVKFCAFRDCTSSGHPFSFYSFPKVKIDNREHRKLAEAQRSAWFQALHRSDITENDLDTRVVCSKHFITGKPALLFETDNPDWAPSVNILSKRKSFQDTVDFLPKKPYLLIRKQIHQNVEGSPMSLQLSSKSFKKLEKSYTPVTSQLYQDTESSFTPDYHRISKSPIKLKELSVQVPRINVELFIKPCSRSILNEVGNNVTTRTAIPNSTLNSKRIVCRIDAQTQTDLSGEYIDKLQRNASQLKQLKEIMGRIKGDISVMTQVKVKIERISCTEAINKNDSK